MFVFLLLLIISFYHQCFAQSTYFHLIGYTVQKAVDSDPASADFQTTHQNCLSNAKCIGLRETSPDKFAIINYPANITENATACSDYLLDRKNLSAANPNPTMNKKFMMEFIYLTGSCPTTFTLKGTQCVAGSFFGVDYVCARYAAFMEPTYNPADKSCYVLTKEALTAKLATES